MVRGRLAVLAATAQAMATYQARCYCGACSVSVVATSEEGATSLCHCSVCRRLSGAPMMASVLLPRSCVTVEGELEELATSKFVVRKRCKTCGSPVAATLGKAQTAVPLALFDRKVLPRSWAPRHHLHYADRVLDVVDGLPKFAERYGGPTCEEAPA